MSGPKGSSYNVESPEERRRREINRLKGVCEHLQAQVGNINEQLLHDDMVDIPCANGGEIGNLTSWQNALQSALTQANISIRIQREVESKCAIIVQQIKELGEHTSNPKNYEVIRPNITSIKDLQAWENDLLEKLEEAEYARARDAALLSYNATKKLDLSNVDLSAKEKSRVSDIQLARRMDKLDKLAKCISEIEDKDIRESFVLEASQLLNDEHDDDFDEKLIQLSTRVRNIKKTQHRRHDAADEISKISHIATKEADELRVFAKAASTQNDVSYIRKKVEELLAKEKKEQDELYVREAIQEVLLGLGYDCGEGFTQTEFGNVVYAQKDPSGDYMLRVQVSNKTPSIFSRIVSCDDTTPEQDKRAEEKMCSDYHDMTAGLREYGIETVLTREEKPGEHPLDKIGAEHKKQIDQARRRRRSAVANQRRHV